MAMNYQMDSIWIEEDRKHDKLHVHDPNIELINSDTPVLLSRKNIELPPLPPTSYFQHVLDQKEAEKKSKEKKKLANLFKKLSLTTREEDKARPKRKISTPFEFKHVSHVNQESPITNKTFELPIQRRSQRRGGAKHRSTCSRQNSHSMQEPPLTPDFKNAGIAFNTTAPTFNDSFENASSSLEKQLESPTSSRLPRSSLASADIFTRSASMSTMATTVSSSAKSRKLQHHNRSIDEEPNRKIKQSSHSHSESASSIENLRKIEKSQITKQCSIDYTSSFTYPQPLESWGTPDPENVARQSWIYEELSPFRLKRSNSISHSPFNADQKNGMNLFQNEMETLLDNTDVEYRKIVDSIGDFKSMLQTECQNLTRERYDLSSESHFDYKPNENYNTLHKAKAKREERSQSFNNESLKLDAFKMITEESAESTPRQHYTSILLPSMVN